MLFKIDPDNVKRECHFIFQDGFRSLKYFDDKVIEYKFFQLFFLVFYVVY